MKNVLLATEFFPSSIQRLRKGIVQFAQHNNWHLSVLSRRFQLPHYWRGDGILMHVYNSPQLLSFLERNANTPIVSFSSSSNMHRCKFSFGRVHEDEFKIGQIAARHFIEHGCTHACWYGNNTRRLRGRSFLRAMRQVEISTTEIIPPPCTRDLPWDQKNNWLTQQLSRLPLPCFIFCENDMWSYEILEAALLMKLNVPGDIMILGVDNDTTICEPSMVPLSSIDNRLEKIGHEGAAMLDAMMKGTDVHKRLLIPPAPEVVVHKSTDFLAIEHPILKRAIHYLRCHFTDPEISVKLLAQATFVSESGLRKLFRSHLKITPLQLIHKLRIQEACKLLRTTDMKVNAVARTVGFSETRRFYDVFFKQMNCTPARFRNEQT